MTIGGFVVLGIAGAAVAQCPNSWSPLGAGLNSANSMEVLDCGQGPELYVTSPTFSGGQALGGLGAWNGSSWRNARLAASPQPGIATLFDGRLFYFNGGFQSCTNFGPSFNLPGRALTVYDDGLHGPRIFLGTDDGTTTARVLVWNGASWDPFITVSGVWFQDPSNRRIATLTTYDDDGPGPHRPVLVVGGAFMHINTFLPDCNNIARWDGTTWSRFGNGLLGSVQPVVTCAYAADIGNGPRLYAAGALSAAGSGPVEQIAQWDGQQWLSMGNGVDASGVLSAMAAWDDGGGTKLWVSGSVAPGTGGLSAWDGSQWSAPTGGVHNGGVLALRVHDDGRGRALFVAGTFTSVGPNGSISAVRIARYGPTPCRANCDGSLQGSCATLNVLDFNCFLNRFAAQDNRANCDGSTVAPVLNVLDFNCFLNAFGAGCP